MVKFEKISDGKYRAVCSIDINKQADDILRNISLDNVDNYLDANNDSLKKSLLARIIASYFFKDPSINFNKHGFATIVINGLGYKLKISVGIVNVDDTTVKQLAGVFYSLD